MKAAVITCSNRSARGERPDDSGGLLATSLAAAGHHVVHRVVVPDEVDAIRGAVRDALAAGASVVLTTGGTGLTPTDVTPEALAPMLGRQIPGIAEALRAVSRDTVPTSVLSRGVAGEIDGALVVTLPGSPGGVRDGLAVLIPLLDHAVDQLHGGDHRPGGGPGSGGRQRAGVRAGVSDQPLDVAAHERAVANAAAGALVSFRGVVRDHDHGRAVTQLEYQAHPSAGEVLETVARRYTELPGVLAVAVSHRTGTLAVGDVALVAVVATAHRHEAFALCARLVDEVKATLPVWKRQVFADGSDEWVNCP